jgi:hypothetical protein
MIVSAFEASRVTPGSVIPTSKKRAKTKSTARFCWCCPYNIKGFTLIDFVVIGLRYKEQEQFSIREWIGFFATASFPPLMIGHWNMRFLF